MDWKELTDYTRSLTGMASHKLGEMTDLAVLYLNLKTAQSRLNLLYEAFGKVSYRHFTGTDSLTEELTEYVKEITLVKREIASLKRAIRQKKEKAEAENGEKETAPAVIPSAAPEKKAD